MKYSKFELLAMAVGFCAVLGTILARISETSTAADYVGQALILVALFGGLHYGRKGALISFLGSTAVYAVVAYGFSPIDKGAVTQIFIMYLVVFGIVSFVAGELNVRLKYLFIKLEHHDFVDDITSLYNAKYLAKLIDKYISEFDRYGSKFSLSSITLNESLLAPLKKKARQKLIRDLGNSVIRGNIRGADEAARLEGTTFMVLYPNTNFDGATCATIRVKEKIRNYLDRHGLETDEGFVATTILEYPKDKDALEDMAVNLQNGGPGEKSKPGS